MIGKEVICTNKRLISEAQILLSKNAYITVDTIATTLNYSNKTVRNDLIILEDWLKEFNLSLDKKIGVGIAIRGDESIKLKVLNDITIKSNFIENYSPEDRVNYILAKLFTTSTRLRIRDLSDILHASRATIHKDLLDVEKWLKNYNIELIRKTNYGIEVAGSETNLREAMLYLVCSNKTFLELKDILINDENETGVTSTTLKIFKSMIPINLTELKNTVFHTEGIINYNLTDESLLALLVSTIIVFIRTSTDNYISISRDAKDRLVNTIELNVALELCANLKESFHVELPEDEIYSLALRILCSKTNSFDNNNLSISGFQNADELETLNLAANLILNWENKLNLPLNQDKELLSSLVLHLKPVINSIKYGHVASNPILDEILKYYPNTFKVVKDSIYILEDYLNLKISDDELGYITLHLASAIDRAKQPLKTLLVCHGGTGESKLLRNKIVHEINELDIVLSKSSIFLKQSDLEGMDLIISTVPLRLNTDKKIINITPLLSKQDIVRLHSIIRSIYSMKNSLSINK